MSDFNKALEETLKSQDGVEKALKRKLVPAGVYSAIIQSVAQTASTAVGSQAKAYTFTYLITEGDQSGETVKENIYYTKRDGSPLEYAQKNIIRRLLAGGQNAESLRSFRMPKTEKDPGDFVKLFGRPVRITVENKAVGGTGPAAGTIRAEVARVEANSATASAAGQAA